VLAIGLAVMAILCLRRPADSMLIEGLRRALLFGGLAGVIACGVRVLTASGWTIGADGRALGLYRHAAWGAWLTTAAFAVCFVAGLAEWLAGRRAAVAEVSARLAAPQPSTSPTYAAPTAVAADSRSLLEAAFRIGDEASIAALVAAGPEAVDRFRDALNGSLQLDLPRDQAQTLVANATAVSCTLASTYPAKYVAMFAEPGWMRHQEVLLGLGYTQRPEAVPVLVTALLSELPAVTRASAAIALRYFAGEQSHRALIRALSDPEEPVRFHAQASLEAMGVSPSA
jgi:hypothetical protein